MFSSSDNAGASGTIKRLIRAGGFEPIRV